MPDTYTGNYDFTLPELGGSADTWGEKLNENWRSLDLALRSIQQQLDRADAGAPPGMLAFMAVQTKNYNRLANPQVTEDLIVHPGWLVCQGWPVNGEGQFSRLRQALINMGYPYGRLGDDPRLPYAGGVTLRAVDLGAGRDPAGNRDAGNYQEASVESHGHSGTTSLNGEHGHGASSRGAGGHTHSGTTSYDGSHQHPIRINSPRDGRPLEAGYALYYGDRTGVDGSSMQAAGGHSHTLNINGVSDHTHTIDISQAGDHNHSFDTQRYGGEETRMKNMSFVLCIRY